MRSLQNKVDLTLRPIMTIYVVKQRSRIFLMLEKYAELANYNIIFKICLYHQSEISFQKIYQQQYAKEKICRYCTH